MGTIHGKRIVLAGGGTGGHITPLLVVGKQLKKLGAELTLMGDFGNGRFALLTDELDVPVVQIPAGKLRRYFSWQNIMSPGRTLRGILAAGQALRRFRPDAVFAKGGYASFPVIVAAHRLGIPIIIHESDATMGLANRWSIRFATKVCVNFSSSTFPTLYRNKIVETGTPIHEEAFTLRRRAPHGKPTILVTGGSQGSRLINQVVALAKPRLSDYQILHITGPGQMQHYAALASPAYEVYDLVAPHKFYELLGRSDVVISRGGATSYAEISAAGRPAIIIPLPSAANNHQLVNAQAWEKAGAVRVLREDALSSENLVKIVHDIFQTSIWQKMATAAARLAQPQAADSIVAVIGEVVQ